MGSNKSVLKDNGYTVTSKQRDKTLVKNKGGDQFIVKKLRAHQDDVSNFLQMLSHPHIVEHKEIITDRDCLYLVMELCEGGDLAQKIKDKKEKNVPFFVEKKMGTQGDQTNGVKTLNWQWTEVMENNQILDWTVKICMALKHLHDQEILHKNLQPKSICFTACGTVRLGEFGAFDERLTKTLSYDAPEKSKPDNKKSEIWSLGCVISEMCKCTFKGTSTAGKHSSSNEALPETFSEDFRQLVKDTLQKDPAKRPSVSEILMRPFIIKHLYQTSIQTTDELYKTLDVLRNLAEGLETVHFNTTVSSLTGGVVGLAGGITSVVGLILAPFTLGASLIVTGVGIGTAVAGGITAGASNITNMVNQQTNRQKIKMIITEFQEKITSIICCIQNISEAVETLENEFSTSSLPGSLSGMSAGVRLGRGLGGIPELIRLTQVVNIGKIAAQAARAVRVVETVTGVLSALFIAVDIFFVFLDSKEIHNLRSDYALKSSQESTSNQSAGSTDETSNNRDKTNLLSSNTQQAEQLKSETMKFVSKIKETTEELRMILDTLRDALNPNSETPNTDN
ncbi:hypothetical protein QQF64_031084 [Cirrhinus molitorella]|uniref:Protein kinase domain-containing protein n=1 Tax=Cirrhinus molitorella TaxID=172907 RepID=A0ABR3N5B4_9TELE